MVNKEKWFQPNDETRGFQVRGARFNNYIWSFFGEYVFHVLIDPFKRLRTRWLRLFGAKIGKGTFLHSKCVIVSPYKLNIGDNCFFDQYVYINGSINVGDNVSVSSFTKFIAGGHDVRSRHFDYKDKPITIENSAFIGANSVIMGGVKIGTFSVIGANSFVTKDVPDNKIAYGNPVKVVSERIPDEVFKSFEY